MPLNYFENWVNEPERKIFIIYNCIYFIVKNNFNHLEELTDPEIQVEQCKSPKSHKKNNSLIDYLINHRNEIIIHNKKIIFKVIYKFNLVYWVLI